MSDKPTVKVNPTFAKKETVIHKGTREELVITEITKAGLLRCAGVAGLLLPSAVEKKLPA